jgi:hypothetical protein
MRQGAKRRETLRKVLFTLRGDTPGCKGGGTLLDLY